MDTFFQGLIIVFREGLEAFLIIVVLLEFLSKTKNVSLKKSAWHGAFAGVGASLLFGGLLIWLSSYIGTISTTAKLWESLASFIAVLLVSTLIVGMIKYGKNIHAHIKNKAENNLTQKGIFLLAMFMIAREGSEIAIFAFAGKYSLLPIVSGLTLSLILATLIHYSIVRVKLGTIFSITLAYLILQAGFLLGYSIHEGLSALKSLGMIDAGHAIFTKAFDLSKTIFYHKEGIVGVPMYIFLGWYSKPELVQFIVQYGYTGLLFWFWSKRK
jgi:high-affinity iron transporter